MYRYRRHVVLSGALLTALSAPVWAQTPLLSVTVNYNAVGVSPMGVPIGSGAMVLLAALLAVVGVLFLRRQRGGAFLCMLGFAAGLTVLSAEESYADAVTGFLAPISLTSPYQTSVSADLSSYADGKCWGDGRVTNNTGYPVTLGTITPSRGRLDIPSATGTQCQVGASLNNGESCLVGFSLPC